MAKKSATSQKNARVAKKTTSQKNTPRKKNLFTKKNACKEILSLTKYIKSSGRSAWCTERPGLVLVESAGDRGESIASQRLGNPATPFLGASIRVPIAKYALDKFLCIPRSRLPST
jgi:hypothetical protein